MNEIVNKALINFLYFLNNSAVNFKEIKSIVENPDLVEGLINDFYQTNWEIFVESIICKSGKEFMEVYGEGADCNKNSSRVSFSNKNATHRILCKSINDIIIFDKDTNEKIELNLFKFNSFVSLNNNDIHDGILLEHLNDDEYTRIDTIDIEFIKVPIAKQ